MEDESMMIEDLRKQREDKELKTDARHLWMDVYARTIVLAGDEAAEENADIAVIDFYRKFGSSNA